MCSLRQRCPFCYFQAEDGIRDLVRSRGLGDVYKRQGVSRRHLFETVERPALASLPVQDYEFAEWRLARVCLLYTSDAADERSRVDLGGRRIIK